MSLSLFHKFFENKGLL